MNLDQTMDFCLDKFKGWAGNINPLPDDKILDWSTLKQSADDNFKFDENARKFSKWVENTVGKGEIARVFKRLVSQGCQKVSLCGNGLMLVQMDFVSTYLLYTDSETGSCNLTLYQTTKFYTV